MKMHIIGGSWITPDGYGVYADRKPVRPAAGEPVIPRAEEIFAEPLARYSRFDNFTRLGCAAVGLALKEAGLDGRKDKRRIGLVISSLFECYETDIDYYATTIERGGMFASPHKFSYTLPGIVLGECAAYFKLTGPTLVLGEDRDKPGGRILNMAGLLLDSGQVDTLVAGWLDYPPDKKEITDGGAFHSKGAFFVVLTTKEQVKVLKTMDSGEIYSLNIFDLFG